MSKVKGYAIQNAIGNVGVGVYLANTKIAERFLAAVKKVLTAEQLGQLVEVEQRIGVIATAADDEVAQKLAQTAETANVGRVVRRLTLSNLANHLLCGTESKVMVIGGKPKEGRPAQQFHVLATAVGDTTIYRAILDQEFRKEARYLALTVTLSDEGKSRVIQLSINQCKWSGSELVESQDRQGLFRLDESSSTTLQELLSAVAEFKVTGGRSVEDWLKQRISAGDSPASAQDVLNEYTGKFASYLYGWTQAMLASNREANKTESNRRYRAAHPETKTRYQSQNFTLADLISRSQLAAK